MAAVFTHVVGRRGNRQEKEEESWMALMGREAQKVNPAPSDGLQGGPET